MSGVDGVDGTEGVLGGVLGPTDGEDGADGVFPAETAAAGEAAGVDVGEGAASP